MAQNSANSMRAAQCGLLATALALSCGLTSLALEPSTPLANYGRQAWGMENGLPQNTVQALAQTRDGFVWLGTEVGLVRFDGNGFAVFDRNSTPALPGSDVRCLLETKDGALWIGTSEGLARWKDGVAKIFTDKDGLPGNQIRGLEEDELGYFWVWTEQAQARLDGSRFIPYWTVDGIGGGGARPSVVDPRSLGWFPVFLSAGDMVRGSNIALQIDHGDHVIARLAVGHEIPGSRIQRLFADREGSLWIGTNAGLARWSDGKVQRLPVTDPLATASVLALMEDREGNIWVGTETDGLHILRDQRFRTLGAREGLSSDATTAVVEDSADTLWVGSNGAGLNAIRRGADGARTVRAYTVKDGLLSDVILSLASASNGDLWVGTPDGLNRIRGGAIEGFTSGDGLPDDFIRSLLADADGSLWIGTRRGLAHWDYRKDGPAGGHVETYTKANGLGSDLVGAMARDGHGDLWVATLAGLSRMKSGKYTTFTTKNGLPSNVITALLTTYDGFLVIGTQDHGIEIWDPEGSMEPDGPILQNKSIRAITEDRESHLWMATADGLTRCDRGQSGQIRMIGVANCIDFGPADGLRSRETATNSHPSAWRSRDGDLWFATPKGLVEVDPAHFPVNTVPPPVALERFAVDDVAQALGAAAVRLEVPAGHVHFEFDYAGMSFTTPQKVRYRYMLEGFDRDWTEAGARRTAYYTNIPPGQYTFRVQAANNDGLWNTGGAALTFELRPHFYQTAWFYALLLAAMAGMVVMLLRLRLRRAETEFRAVLGERNRIAREIHDTLAQGYVGISVQLEVLAELLRLEKLKDAAKHLDLTRGYVRQGLDDARQSIWALRSQDSGETTLPVKLRRMVESEHGAGLESRFSIFGAYRPLPPGTEREILRVAQEAIHNVKKHAGAKNLFVQLEYGPGEVAMEVRDDGQGFAAGADGAAPGHYGLTGMKERAEAIGGTLEVTSEPGAGTTVRMRAAAAREERSS